MTHATCVSGVIFRTGDRSLCVVKYTFASRVVPSEKSFRSLKDVQYTT